MKKIFFIAIFVATATLAYSQRLGLMGGYEMAHGNQTTTGNIVNFGAKPGSGFLVGVLFDWDITKRWGIEMAAQYNLRTMNYQMHYLSDTLTNMKRQLYYLDIPVHAYVNFPFKKWTLALYFGPAFNVGLHGKDKAWENTEWQKPVMREEDEIYGDKGRLYRFEIAAEIGLTAKVQNFNVSAGYSHGFNNLDKSKYDWTLPLPTDTKKYVSIGEFKLSVAYMFNLKR